MNDVLINKEFKKCFGIAASKYKPKGNIAANSKLTRNDVNHMLVEAEKLFWAENDKELSEHNTIIRNFMYTGMKPFNKNCIMWKNAIATTGVSRGRNDKPGCAIAENTILEIRTTWSESFNWRGEEHECQQQLKVRGNTIQRAELNNALFESFWVQAICNDSLLGESKDFEVFVGESGSQRIVHAVHIHARDSLLNKLDEHNREWEKA